MTKTERLQELKEQGQFYKVLDKYFDAGWREFVKGIQRQNDISNLRMFKILKQIKGVDFVVDLIKFMKQTGNKSALISLTKIPKGILVKDNRFKNIPELMIEKFPSGSYRKGNIFIKVERSRWIKFTF